MLVAPNTALGKRYSSNLDLSILSIITTRINELIASLFTRNVSLQKQHELNNGMIDIRRDDILVVISFTSVVVASLVVETL